MQNVVGLLKTNSKYIYGFSKRGTPQYLFQPLDKNLKNIIVGSNEKDLTVNYLALVDYENSSLLRILGPANNFDIENEALKWLYCKSDRKLIKNYESLNDLNHLNLKNSNSNLLDITEWNTFNIDPKGCEDIDDCFSYTIKNDVMTIAITITDVASQVELDSKINKNAKKTGFTFYDEKSRIPMLPYSVEKQCSLTPNGIRRGISVILEYNINEEFLTYKGIFETLVKNKKTYTYENFYDLFMISFFKKVVGINSDSHEWVEKMMIFYNIQVATLLKEYNTGIFRKTIESENKVYDEMISKYCPFLYNDKSEYCSSEKDLYHSHLKLVHYCTATSPIRRYVDLENQRFLKHVLQFKNKEIPPEAEACIIIRKPSIEDIEHYNQSFKSYKKYNRDMFFLNLIKQNTEKEIEGIILSDRKIYVSEWKRIISVRNFVSGSDNIIEKRVKLKYYYNMNEVNWKNKIVFQILE